MRVGSRGQVVIPADIRRRAGLHEGDEVVVEYDGTAIKVTRAEGSSTRGQRLVDHMRGRGGTAETSGMSTDEIMELLRDE